MFYYNYFFNPLHFVFTGIGWLLIVWLVVWLIRSSSRPERWNTNITNRSIEILKERYAKGEISKEEFETKKKDLL